jgi:hypothetical protein
MHFNDLVELLLLGESKAKKSPKKKESVLDKNEVHLRYSHPSDRPIIDEIREMVIDKDTPLPEFILNPKKFGYMYLEAIHPSPQKRQHLNMAQDMVRNGMRSVIPVAFLKKHMGKHGLNTGDAGILRGVVENTLATAPVKFLYIMMSQKKASKAKTPAYLSLEEMRHEIEEYIKKVSIPNRIKSRSKADYGEDPLKSITSPIYIDGERQPVTVLQYISWLLVINFYRKFSISKEAWYQYYAELKSKPVKDDITRPLEQGLRGLRVSPNDASALGRHFPEEHGTETQDDPSSI